MPTTLEYTIPSMTGRTVVITGANSGLGKAAALVLAGVDARVVLAVRSLEKGRAAAEAMGGDVEVRELDLADLGSVRSFAETFTDPIDILINNAGIMIPPLRRTAEGFESQFGTNHLGHFALTNLLLPQIRDRVVTLSSLAHKSGAIDFDDLNWERRPYKPMVAYGQSKLANLLFTSELQRRLTECSSPVIAIAAHPGLAATNLFGRSGHRVRDAISAAAIGLISQSEQHGALPTLCAATADIPGNSYVGPGGFQQTRGEPKLVGRSAEASDAEVARRLWTVSEELTGIGFPL
ncbi:oxidoreductase [Brevibacterium sp. UCMA 11754]|uniref:oxidoreductase n=1 Tax=Brevibacterium sp. UCMA 11754 TaxID=2749198 RepID=UPI001F262EAD|nr:oxidoreductase [Brevibacterium sp. UCMA 11754]